MTRRRRSSSWSPMEAASSLVALAFLERALAHIFAGWAVKMPVFEVKLVFAAHMHRAIERATQLKSRIHGLCHAVAEEATISQGWQTLLAHVDRSASPAALVTGIYGFLYPRLIEMYRAHVLATDADGDRASLELVRSVLAVIQSERREGLSLASFSDRAAMGKRGREFEELWREREAGKPLALEDALWQPLDRVPAAVRPENSRFCPTGSLGLLPADPLHDPRDIAMLLHKELDEEFTTLELMARNSYEHPEMPWNFHRDMARQASDEARHASMLGRLMRARNVRHGDFEISTASYDGLYEFEPCEKGSRKELVWRMLIRQTFMEGLAVDNLAYDIERRRLAGQTDIVQAFEYILRDEVFHAQSGLRWSREILSRENASLVEARAEAFAYFTARAESAREHFVMENLDEAMAELAVIEQGKAQRGGKRPERPLNRTGRRQAGYTEEDISQIVAWGFARDKSVN
ncbi:MAG: DUF455 family protein [Proteobacteria bacterium]|nr:DUF455 family protein [Pseudomonadota bacterium]